MLVKPEFKDHPRYRQAVALKARSFEDFLQLGVILWASQHGLELPLDRSMWEDELEIDFLEFKSWLYGEVENFRVIKGGMQTEEEVKE